MCECRVCTFSCQRSSRKVGKKEIEVAQKKALKPKQLSTVAIAAPLAVFEKLALVALTAAASPALPPVPLEASAGAD